MRGNRRPAPLGLLGGTFNPPHRGHLKAARAALKQLRLGTVLFIPSSVPPHKKAPDLAAARHRSRMVRLAVKPWGKFRVSDIEMRRRGTSFTIDTVRALRRKFPRHTMYFIIGSDTVREVPTWKEWRALLGLIKFAVVPRPGHPPRMLAGHANRFIPIRMRGLSVSSHRIRELFSRGRRTAKGLPAAVAAYIRKHGLYGTG